MSVASRLEDVIRKGQQLGKLALYFGCGRGAGHYMHAPSGETIWRPRRAYPDFPWEDGIIDGGFLVNAGVQDIPDGRVFWTCGGADAFWYAFYWWDRSVDMRGASNSGFYARGFGWSEEQAAFDYTCTQYPAVVNRQKHPLVLQVNLRSIGTKP
jgi:hypothetical protein